MGKTSALLTVEICREYISKELFEPKVNPSQSDKSIGLIGIELETFPVWFSDNQNTKACPVHLKNGEFPLHQMLEQFAGKAGGKFDSGERAGISSIKFPNGSSFQYEPGGQIEIVTNPCKSLSELDYQLRQQQEILDQITEKHQIHFTQVGTNPWFDSAQIGLQLDKPRYRALQTYFAKLNPFGVQMMRQTCSLHVNLDLGQREETQVNRIVAANLLAPFATAIFANSSSLEGKQCERKSQRSYIWQQLDPKRSGFWLPEIKPSLPVKEALIAAYLNFALSAPIIHIKELGERVFSKHCTLAYWLQHPLEGISPTLEDLENHLSLLYPELRPKGFLEIRTSDALPRAWQLAPAYFYAGLLYSEEALDKALELLLPFASEVYSLWQKASFGFESSQILDISKKLMGLAIQGLETLPADFAGTASLLKLQEFNAQFTSQGKSLADRTVFDF